MLIARLPLDSVNKRLLMPRSVNYLKTISMGIFGNCAPCRFSQYSYFSGEQGRLMPHTQKDYDGLCGHQNKMVWWNIKTISLEWAKETKPTLAFWKWILNGHLTCRLKQLLIWFIITRWRLDVQEGNIWQPGQAGDHDVSMLRTLGGPGVLWGHHGRRLHLERHFTDEDHQSSWWPCVCHVLTGQGTFTDTRDIFKRACIMENTTNVLDYSVHTVYICQPGSSRLRGHNH